MELRAAIAALRALGRPSIATLYTDSEYLRQGVTKWLARWQANGWRTASRRRVKNRDLWQALLQAQKPHEVHWHWVKGHSGDPTNMRADYLARQAITDIGHAAPPDQEPLARQLNLL
jgi:ribonuclease HI